jgi:hypothetical protein
MMAEAAKLKARCLILKVVLKIEERAKARRYPTKAITKGSSSPFKLVHSMDC